MSESHISFVLVQISVLDLHANDCIFKQKT